MTMQKPLVSVIITTKNEEKNIGRLLRSLTQQTDKRIEVVVVDNNSNDKTKKIVRKYTPLVFNFGPERSAQRNFGVTKARGKYVLILDADMKLTPGVIESCLENIDPHGALIVPEKTVGKGFMARIRCFEREMYQGDPTIEVARFFTKRIFQEFGGYDLKLTGTEDYDLPKRISQKYSLGWAKAKILHYESGLTLPKQLKKKYYYAKNSALYADKYPELVRQQGILIVRRAYLRHWRQFMRHPQLALPFLFVRTLETLAAVSGYIRAVGIFKFLQTLARMFKA